MEKSILYYFIFINIMSFIFMFVDKQKAIKNHWRISEDTLMSLSIIGGSLGIFFGMYYFRHKTKKNKFKIGVPFIIFIQLYIVYILIY